MKNPFQYAIILIAVFTSCRQAAQKDSEAKLVTPHTNVAEIQIKDSAQLVHIKDGFYRSRWGQLFEKTVRQGIKTADVVYYNGLIPQDIDLITFQKIGDFYAKDKKSVYFHMGTSDKMLFNKIPGADNQTFKMLKKGDAFVFLAVDKNHLYDHGTVVDSINPEKMKLIQDKDGFVVKIISGGRVYKPEL